LIQVLYCCADNSDSKEDRHFCQINDTTNTRLNLNCYCFKPLLGSARLSDGSFTQQRFRHNIR